MQCTRRLLHTTRVFFLGPGRVQSHRRLLHTTRVFFLGPGRVQCTRRLLHTTRVFFLGPGRVQCTRRLLHTTRVFFLGPGRMQSLVDYCKLRKVVLSSGPSPSPGVISLTCSMSAQSTAEWRALGCPLGSRCRFGHSSGGSKMYLQKSQQYIILMLGWN